VILRIRHRQPEWTPEEIPSFMKADADCAGDYLLVNQEGELISIGDAPARIRVLRKRPKLACLAQPDNHIGSMEGGCLKGEEPAEPIVVEGTAIEAQEPQPVLGVAELADDIASEADKETAEAATEQPKGEEAEADEGEQVTQPTDI